MTLLLDDLALLRCPDCRGRLLFTGRRRFAQLAQGTLDCAGCAARWPVRDGLARLVRDESVQGTDRLMRLIYDSLPRLHDPAVRWMLPLMQGGHEDEVRPRYLRRMALAELRRPAGAGGDAQPQAAPRRVLEVSIGTGANLPLLLQELGDGSPVQLWGLDLSTGMMSCCRRRVARGRLRSPDGSHVRLMLADAHALPFPDGSFDRVFHVGGIGGFRDPAKALDELARVARPGTPIVVVDEALDPACRNTLLHRLAFWSITFYDSHPHCPVDALPGDAEILAQEQLSRFYYGLTFRRPADPGPGPG